MLISVFQAGNDGGRYRAAIYLVPIAEATGLVQPIGNWVLGEACRQSRAWLDDGWPLFPIAVKISALEFRTNSFVETIRALLENARLEPRVLELELTESVLMRDGESTISTLQSLKTIGVRFAEGRSVVRARDLNPKESMRPERHRTDRTTD